MIKIQVSYWAAGNSVKKLLTQMHFISISRNNGFFKVDSDSLFKQENNLVLIDTIHVVVLVN